MYEADEVSIGLICSPRREPSLQIFSFVISLLAQRNNKERAPRECPWNPSAAAIFKMTAVDVVSLTETPACHNSGSRVAEGKRT